MSVIISMVNIGLGLVLIFFIGFPKEYFTNLVCVILVVIIATILLILDIVKKRTHNLYKSIYYIINGGL